MRVSSKRAASLSAKPEIHQLAVFLKVVEARSFAGAARLIGRTQPAVSQTIARLEELYGGDLFERGRGARLELTPIGEAILPSVRIILDAIDEQMVRAVAVAQGRSGNLTLGFSPGFTSGPLRDGVAAFVASSPLVQLRLVEELHGELHRQLSERTIDLIIGAFMPDFAGMALMQERLWNERLVVALPATHQIAFKNAVGWADIANLPIVMRESQAELVAYRALFDRIDLRIDCSQHAVSWSTLLDMVGMGIGATLLFESAVTPHKAVAFRQIAEQNATAPVDALWMRDDRNPLRHRLLGLIRVSKDGGQARSARQCSIDSFPENRSQESETMRHLQDRASF